MPIYEYRCPKCNERKEVILQMADSDSPQQCECGERMTKLVSLPMPAIFIVTNRDTMIRTLNDEEGGYRLPGGDKHGARYKSVIGRNLDTPKPVIGKGFG